MSQNDERVGDILRTYFAEVSSIPFHKQNDHFFILKEDIEDFAIAHDIYDQNIIIESINTFNPRRFYDIIDENTTEFAEEYKAIREALDYELVQQAKSYGNPIGTLKRLSDKASATICHKEYDKEAELDSQIKVCKSVIADIEKEKQVIQKDEKKSNSYKFTMHAVRELALFTATLLLSHDLYNKILSGLAAAISLPQLILSVSDYRTLLDHYESSISRTIDKLEEKKEILKVKEKHKNSKGDE